MSTEKKGGKWLGVIALALVCAMFASITGAAAGGAAGYFFGRQAARAEVAQTQPEPVARRDSNVRPQPVIPPQGWGFQVPEQAPAAGLGAYAQVESVTEGTPAAQAGVRAGDRIVAVDGDRLSWRHDLATAIGEHKVGDKVELTIERDGEEQTLGVVLGENPDNAGRPYLGLTYRMAVDLESMYPNS